MTTQESKKRILDRIREGRNTPDRRIKVKTERPVRDSRLYLDMVDELPELVFARNLVDVKGKFSYCTNTDEVVDALKILVKEGGWSRIACFEPNIQAILKKARIPFSADPVDIKQAEASVTGCEYMIARTGSVMVSSGQGTGRRAFSHPPVHVVIGFSGQVVIELSEALEKLRLKYPELPSQVSLITGPSRTADIEKTLVLGAHGPKDFYLFLVNEL